jgi:hypothetical protein
VRRAVAVVGADRLALACADRLRSRDVDVLALRADGLADLRVTLSADRFEIEGRPVGAILWRAPVGASALAEFAPEDRGFVLAEVSATLLAATNHASVLAVNRLDAEAWFEEGQWVLWRRRLQRAGVPVCGVSVGDLDGGRWWRPYVGGPDRPVPVRAVRRALGTAVVDAPVVGAALFVGDEAIGGAPSTAVRLAGRVLTRQGLALKAISYDDRGTVVSVNPYPEIADNGIDSIAQRLARLLHDHLRRR